MSTVVLGPSRRIGPLVSGVGAAGLVTGLLLVTPGAIILMSSIAGQPFDIRGASGFSSRRDVLSLLGTVAAALLLPTMMVLGTFRLRARIPGRFRVLGLLIFVVAPLLWGLSCADDASCARPNVAQSVGIGLLVSAAFILPAAPLFIPGHRVSGLRTAIGLVVLMGVVLLFLYGLYVAFNVPAGAPPRSAFGSTHYEGRTLEFVFVAALSLVALLGAGLVADGTSGKHIDEMDAPGTRRALDEMLDDYYARGLIRRAELERFRSEYAALVAGVVEHSDRAWTERKLSNHGTVLTFFGFALLSVGVFGVFWVGTSSVDCRSLIDCGGEVARYVAGKRFVVGWLGGYFVGLGITTLFTGLIALQGSRAATPGSPGGMTGVSEGVLRLRERIVEAAHEASTRRGTSRDPS
ncbi:MAG: hypothetical protein HY556_09670 [Euryarchaeota archaeon]|nr:hypothetical protein [Euryarchaeota archaeon]